MTFFSYDTRTEPRISFGLVTLQADETIEADGRSLCAPPVELLVSRVPSGTEVTKETLEAMAGHLTTSASLLPRGTLFDVVGYGCTSGTSVIGADRIKDLVQAGVETKSVTEPVSALITACRALGLHKLIFLSPYIEDVSNHLRQVLQNAGIETPTFGTFSESREAAVSRISGASIVDAARALAKDDQGADAIFLSCTNLRTLDIIPQLERELDMPVLSSNLVLFWHMHELAGQKISTEQLDCALVRR